MLWFYSDRDYEKFLAGIWFTAKWLVWGPLIGGGLLGAVGLLLAGWDGAVNGLYMGLAFGTMGGVVTAGARGLSVLDD